MPKILLSEHALRVSFEEQSELVSELAEMFLCPLELHPSTGERFRHGGTMTEASPFRQTLLSRRHVDLTATVTPSLAIVSQLNR